VQNDALLLHLTNFDRRLQMRRSVAGAALAADSAASCAADDAADSSVSSSAHRKKLTAVAHFIGLACDAAKLDPSDRVELPSEAELDALPAMEAMSRLRDAERLLLTKLGAMTEPVHKRVQVALQYAACCDLPSHACVGSVHFVLYPAIERDARLARCLLLRCNVAFAVSEGCRSYSNSHNSPSNTAPSEHIASSVGLELKILQRR
jgi:hypothetical protein